MTSFPDLLATHWPAAFIAVVGIAVLLLGLLRRWRAPSFIGIGLLLLAAGGLALPERMGVYFLLAAMGLALAMAILLLLSGVWSRYAGYFILALALVGLGGWVLPPLADIRHALVGADLLSPWWLLLLLAIPLFVVLSLPRLNRHEPRPWIALILRCLGVAALALALAEPRLRQDSGHVTALFVVDRSQSIPEEPGADPHDPGRRVDLRALRVRDFLNAAVAQRGRGHERDLAGLIVFGRRPRLEFPPGDAPRLNLPELPDVADGDATDIAAALKLALASFPEGSGRRIVLISDGNENQGNALEQARLARTLGIEIDVLPLAARQRNEDEVLVERVDAPPVIEQGTQLPLRVLVRSFNPHVVVGRLTVKQVTEEADHLVATITVRLRQGLNAFSFTRPLTDEQRSYTYEAEFLPQRVESEAGEVLQEGLPGDRVQNNRAAAHVVARGRRRILLLEGKAGSHAFLAERLAAAGRGKFRLHVEPVAVLDRFKDNDQLAVYLSNFDCILLANVAADQIGERRQEVLRSNTQDQGCGLVMIGGPESYGAGGWQNTPVEKALPVDSEIDALQVEGKGGLVLIMHASEMADGNLWQKRIAKLAVERLSGADEVGVIYFDMGGHTWWVKLEPIGRNRRQILARIDQMQPGDMPDFDPALQMAHDALADPKKQLATKHVILISDGDPQCTMGLLPPMKKDRITVTTVGVACHGVNEDTKMAAIAKATGGRYYGPHTKPGTSDPRQLPAIYIKESRLVSQSFLHEKAFPPVLEYRSGPTEGLPRKLPTLYGFVRTTAKDSPLVEVPIRTPPLSDQRFPVLAYWHYGLGKSVAFTSDAGNPKFWSRDWAEGGVFSQFWEQVIDWSLRPVESRRLNLATEYRDGRVHVLVEARTDDGRPDTTLKLRGGLTAPGHPGAAAPHQDLRFAQTAAGVYEAEVRAEEAGSYFVTAQAVRLRKIKGRDGKTHEVEEGVDGVRGGVTLPYSPEYSELESNTALLEQLREVTGGRHYDEDDVSLAEAARSGVVFRPAPAQKLGMVPIWHWLLALTALLLLADVMVRRLAVDTAAVALRMQKLWAWVRGRPSVEPATAYMDRLQARKAEVGEGLAARRFEGAPVTVSPPDAGPAPTAPAAPAPAPLPTQRGPEPPSAPPADFAEQLLKAKRRVWEERKRGGGNDQTSS